MATTPKEMAAKAAKPKAEAEDQTQPEQGTAPSAPTQEPAQEPAQEPQPEAAPATPDTPAAADPADIAAYCVENGAPNLTANLIREKATMDQVKTRVAARVDIAAKIRERVKAARASGITLDAKFEETAIESGMSLEAVTDTLFGHLTAQQSPEIRGHLSSSDVAGAAAGNHGWDKAFAKA